MHLYSYQSKSDKITITRLFSLFCFTEPPVMIVYPKEDVHLDRYVPEEIVLSCELSRPNGKVTWFKDGQKLQESENIKLKTEGPYRRLKILRSGVEDSGEYVCDTADDSIFFNLNIKGIKFSFKYRELREEKGICDASWKENNQNKLFN